MRTQFSANYCNDPEQFCFRCQIRVIDSVHHFGENADQLKVENGRRGSAVKMLFNSRFISRRVGGSGTKRGVDWARSGARCREHRPSQGAGLAQLPVCRRSTGAARQSSTLPTSPPRASYPLQRANSHSPMSRWKARTDGLMLRTNRTGQLAWCRLAAASTPPSSTCARPSLFKIAANVRGECTPSTRRTSSPRPCTRHARRKHPVSAYHHRSS